MTIILTTRPGFDKPVLSPSKGSARTECEDFTGPDQ